MLKKHKVLISIIALTAGGIVAGLSIWLYEGYTSRQEIFMATAERSLFNVLQEYYQSETQTGETRPDGDAADRGDRHRRKKNDHRLRRDDRRKGGGPFRLLPHHLLENFSLRDEVFEELEIRLNSSLDQNNMATGFELFAQTISKKEFEERHRQNRERNRFTTRPILVNFESKQFLVARFDPPWRYFFASLVWQFLLSVLLLASLIGTFLYLLRTIKKQNEMAVQRKSFVNNMTHELKTPVATVMAAVEAIQRFGAKENKSRMDKYLDVSKQELEHLSGLIERVLQMDFDETNGLRLVKTDFDLVAVIDFCTETAKMGAQKPVVIDFQSPTDPVSIHADEAHIKNVISNLLDNAIKYSVTEAHITIGLQTADDQVEISVSDRGKGIAKAHQKDIFDMFYRVAEGNIHEVKGFGLGLAYVRQVVRQHGGRVEVDSSPGNGSRFIVQIPAHQSPSGRKSVPLAKKRPQNEAQLERDTRTGGAVRR